MIRYCATRRHLYPPRRFFKSWGRELQPRFRAVAYEQMIGRARIPAATYIFSDFERLLPAELYFVQILHRQMLADPARYVLLNDPHRWLDRLDLQLQLRRNGFNDFRTFTVDGPPTDIQFPVFLRRTNDHRGPIGDLLRDEDELRAAVDQLDARDRRRVLAAEYCHTADETGIFRKYSAMKIGKSLIPRHVLFSDEWVTKTPHLVDPEFAAEEARFVDEFRERELIARVFEIAGIDYGRIDYAWNEGRLQVWEINTNPIIVPLPERIHPLRLRAQRHSAELAVTAFEELMGTIADRSSGHGLSRHKRVMWRALRALTRRHAANRP